MFRRNLAAALIALSLAAAGGAHAQPSPEKIPPGLTHWLNTQSNVRHNSNCRHYRNTKAGRPCTANEGKACGTCGG